MHTVTIENVDQTRLQRIEVKAAHDGAKFSNSIVAAHGVRGSFQLDGTTLVIELQSKPFYVPWNTVVSQLTAYIEETV